MYITVKFGQNESLLCNPSCAVINLLTSIKRRAGFAHTNVCLDLSDETGLVKDLDLHKYDYATKFLTSHATYVLVEKQLLPSSDDTITESESSTPIPPAYNYVPLLDKYADLFPNFNIRAQTIEKKKQKRNTSTSPSPAGIRGTKGKSKSQQRASSRRR